MAKKNDNVNHPAHYTQGKIECIDAMLSAFGKANLMVFCVLNAFKYTWRVLSKGKNVEDAEKAIWYLQKYVSLAKEKKPAARKAKKKAPFLSKSIKKIDTFIKKFGKKGKKPAPKALENAVTAKVSIKKPEPPKAPPPVTRAKAVRKTVKK